MPPPPHMPSFEQVYNVHRLAIQHKIRHYCFDRPTAEDIQQEVLIKLWRKLSTYDGHKGTLFSWIMKITINTCIDHLRTVNPIGASRSHKIIDEQVMAPEEPNFHVRGEGIWLTNGLSSDQKIVVIMIYFKGHTQFEVAQLLNVPLGTVKTRQRSALLALRKRCENKSAI